MNSLKITALKFSFFSKYLFSVNRNYQNIKVHIIQAKLENSDHFRSRNFRLNVVDFDILMAVIKKNCISFSIKI